MREHFERLHGSTFIRYGIMAVVVVGVEIATFSFLNSVLKVHYVIATVLSVGIGIILNWFASKHFVFRTTRHAAHKEFVLILVVSLIGVGLQVLVTVLAVEQLGLKPLIGKVAAIIITFFWNYVMRKKYIF